MFEIPPRCGMAYELVPCEQETKRFRAKLIPIMTGETTTHTKIYVKRSARMEFQVRINPACASPPLSRNTEFLLIYESVTILKPDCMICHHPREEMTRS